MIAAPSIHVLGRAAAHAPASSPHQARLRSTIRYADPSSWLAVDALDRAGLAELLAGRGDRTAVVMIAPAGCPEAAVDLGRQAAEGRVSPLRYPAAAPSASLGLCCIVFGLRGPTVTLTMPLASGVPRATWLAGRYLARGDAELAIVATAEPGAARCVVLCPAAGTPAGEPGSAERWLVDGR